MECCIVRRSRLAQEFTSSSPSAVRNPVSTGSYYKGAVVKHAKFGLGTVQRSEGEGDDLKISVSFPGYGVKTLAVKYRESGSSLNAGVGSQDTGVRSNE